MAEPTDDKHAGTAWLITPSDERTPIPSHIAAQIRSIEWKSPARDDEPERTYDEESDEATQAEEPVEDRLQRAFCNGFIEGVRRGSWGRFDHS